MVSAASAWEIATKHRLGKLPDAEELALDIPGAIAGQNFEELPITVEHAVRGWGLAGVRTATPSIECSSPKHCPAIWSSFPLNRFSIVMAFAAFGELEYIFHQFKVLS